jgi:ornithine cyclodeaminase
MRLIGEAEIRRLVSLPEAVDAMRQAVIAQSRGECDTPMPMHLYLEADRGGEVHVKSSFRKGGGHFVLKMAGSFAERPYGMMLLVSTQNGKTVAYFEDGGYLTDLRTAAVAAMVARELGRADPTVGIVGTGVQARLQAELHASVLDLEEVFVWGRNAEHAAACAGDIAARLPHVRATVCESLADLCSRTALIVTATSSREPLLRVKDLQPGTHVSAVGADSPGKRELSPEILRRASLLLVDSLAQCEKLGELQHVLSEKRRAVEIGAFCERPVKYDRSGITVADFTGLGAEDLYVAEACYERVRAEP